MLTNAVPKAQLLSLLRRMSQVIPSSSPKEILTKVKLVFREEQIQLHGTDMNQYLKLIAKCNNPNPGVAIVDYNNFRTIISKMTGDTVYISLENDVVVLKDDRSEFELGTFTNISEFPAENIIDSDRTFEMDINELVLSLDKVQHCMDKEATRYALSSVSIAGTEGGILQITATDGRRISICMLPDIVSQEFSLLIPHDTVKAIGSIMDGVKGKCQVIYTESSFGVEAEDLTFTCRQTEGRYPKLDTFVQSFRDAEYHAIDLPSLRTIASQGLVVSDPEAMGIVLSLDGEKMTVTHETVKAKYKATVPIEHPAETVQVNCQYLHQALAVCKEVQISVAGQKLIIKRDNTTYDMIMGMAR